MVDAEAIISRARERDDIDAPDGLNSRLFTQVHIQFDTFERRSTGGTTNVHSHFPQFGHPLVFSSTSS